MMTPPLDARATSLTQTLEKLKHSELECAKAAACLKEFESIIKNKRQTAEISNETNSEKVQLLKPKSATGVSKKLTGKVQQPRWAAYSRQLKERPSVKSCEVVVSTHEQIQINQVQKRIKDYYKLTGNIEELLKKFVNERKRFLTNLEKSNLAMWKMHNSKNPLLEELGLHMNNTSSTF